jgi:hypothetical protein
MAGTAAAGPAPRSPRPELAHGLWGWPPFLRRRALIPLGRPPCCGAVPLTPLDRPLPPVPGRETVRERKKGVDYSHGDHYLYVRVRPSPRLPSLTDPD